MFKVGDRVRWECAGSDSSKKSSVGTVTAVIPSAEGLDECYVYAFS